MYHFTNDWKRGLLLNWKNNPQALVIIKFQMVRALPMTTRSQCSFPIGGDKPIALSTLSALMTRSATALSFMIMANISLTVQALPETNTVDFESCVLSMPGSPATARADCGFIEVPENPDEPNGTMIPIHVAIAPSTGMQPEPDPVFFFAGGPGQAASETWVLIRGTLDKIREKRDIVMIDQRGTGQSNKLACPIDDDTDLNAELDLEYVAEQTAICRDQLEADLRFYTTDIAMSDYDRVREAMGYKQINIMGVSYGTRAAQVYLKKYPETVRTVVLDSVVPMQLALGQEHAPVLDVALTKVFSDCYSNQECNERFGDSLNQLNALAAELREKARWLTIPDPITGEDREIRMSAETLAVAIRFLSYASETQATLPILIDEAIVAGSLDRLAAQALMVMNSFTGMFARGMELSVICSEDYPFIDTEADHSDTLLGNIFLKSLATQCDLWPRGEVAEDFHNPVVSDLPVLLLSGERDPVTPPHYADQAASTYNNHLNLVARGQSHSVMKHPCFKKVTTDFIAAGLTDDVDITCVEDIEASPFFTSLLGPNP